jgi:hypothetical protein
MSLELLGPPHLGSNFHPAYESDCYALGMIVYEALSWSVHPLRSSLAYPSPGSDWSQVFSPCIWLHTRARYTERRTSRKIFRHPVSRFLRDILGVGAIVSEWVALKSDNRPAAARIHHSLSYLDSSSGVSHHLDRRL